MKLLCILEKELLELLRDKLYILFIVILPILVFLLDVYGINFDVKHIKMAVLNFDRTKYFRDCIDKLISSEYFDLVGEVESYKEAEKLFYQGKIKVLFVFSKDKVPKIQILIDGTYPSRAEIIESYAKAIILSLEQHHSTPSFILNFRVWYNPELASKNFVMPGELVVTLCFFPVLLSCLLVVREKEKGSILNYLFFPVKSWEVILGKAIPYVAISFFIYLILVFISIVLSKTRFMGSFLDLSIVAIFYLFCTVGLGLFISTLAKTQITAMLLAFIIAVLPSYLYSGYLYPLSSMDASARAFSLFVPATYFLSIVRGIYLKGLGLSFYWKEFLSLVLYSILIYALTIFLFKRRAL